MTVTLDTLHALVEQLLDRDAVRDCMYRYARGIDRLDREVVLSAFHPDAIDDHGKYVGAPDGMVDWAFNQHSKAHYSTQHYMMNHRCEIDGNTAHAETYYILAVTNREGEPLSMNGGRYIDRLEKRNGTWRIAVRYVLRDWVKSDVPLDFSDLSSLTSTQVGITPELRKFMKTGQGSKRDRSDLSYMRPLEPDPARVEAFVQLRKLGLDRKPI